MFPHPSPLLRFLLSFRRLSSARDGIAALEFALIAPAFLMLLLGVIETSLVMLTQNTLESAIFSATRTGKTGYVASNSTQIQTIMNTLNTRAGLLLNTSLINVTYKSYSQFSEIGQPEAFVDANGNGTRDSGENYTDTNGNGQYDTDMGASGVGTGSQIVVYTISYPWKIYTPIIGKLFSNNGNLTLTARAVVQNEPY